MHLRTQISNTEKTIKDLASTFNTWVKTSSYQPKYMPDSKLLLSWLYFDAAAEKEIKDYDKFCKLAKEVAALGYKTHTPIPESDFNKAIEELKEREERINQYQIHSFHRPVVKVVKAVPKGDAIDHLVSGYYKKG